MIRFEQRRFDSLGISVPEWTERPNVLGRNSIRANLSAAASSKLDLSVFLNFINIDQALKALKKKLQREGKMPGAFSCPRGMLEFIQILREQQGRTVAAEIVNGQSIVKFSIV